LVRKRNKQNKSKTKENVVKEKRTQNDSEKREGRNFVMMLKKAKSNIKN